MLLAVVGASHPSGELVVQQALNKGHGVVAIVEDAKEVKVKHKQLQVREADVLSPSPGLADHLAGCDVVISCLESEYRLFSEITLYSASVRAIVEAMRAASVTRLVCLSSWWVEDNKNHPACTRYLAKPVLRRQLADQRRAEEYLINECQDIDFTAVRQLCVTDKVMEDTDVMVEPDVDHSDFLEMSIPRGNLAECILKIAEEKLYPKRCVLVGFSKTKPKTTK